MRIIISTFGQVFPMFGLSEDLTGDIALAIQKLAPGFHTVPRNSVTRCQANAMDGLNGLLKEPEKAGEMTCTSHLKLTVNGPLNPKNAWRPFSLCFTSTQNRCKSARKSMNMLFSRFYCVSALFLLMLPAAVQAQFTFTTNNGAITITGYTGTDAIIPSTTNGYPVVAIGYDAFYNSTVTNVVIPGSVTNIGPGAFEICYSLASVTISNGVTAIGLAAFNDCSSLTSVTVPNSVTSIGIYAFENCVSLTSVTVLNTTVANFEFDNCPSLASVALSSGVTSIGQDAFNYCTNLASITIPNSVTNIGPNAFNECMSLESAYFQGNAPPDDGTAFVQDPATVYYLYGTTGWSVTFGGVPAVEETAPSEFTFTTNNSSITIKGSTGPVGALIIPDLINGYPVTSIQYDSFYDSNTLTSVIIPPGVTSIDTDAFEECHNLTNVMIPDTLTSIGQLVFAYCPGLTSVTIPDSLTSLNTGTFAYDPGLTNVIIPGGITSIGYIAFFDDSSLINITIPGSVTSLGVDAFAGCTSLTSVTIPGSVTSIGEQPFADCTGLTNISVNATNPAYCSLNGVLFDKAKANLVEYPAGLPNSLYIIPNGVTNIEADAFSGCTKLTSITIPGSVTNLGQYAFADCLSLANVTIPGSVTSIGAWAFSTCTNLTSVTVPGSVTNMVANAFEGCTSLRSVYFEGNPPAIGEEGFVRPTIVYYLPGRAGWGATFGGVPAVLWNPRATAFTMAGGQFGFKITGPTNALIVVVACTNLVNPVWLPVSTNTLSGSGTSSFSDPQSGNNPNRYYRFSAP